MIKTTNEKRDHFNALLSQPFSQDPVVSFQNKLMVYLYTLLCPMLRWLRQLVLFKGLCNPLHAIHQIDTEEIKLSWLLFSFLIGHPLGALTGCVHLLLTKFLLT